MLLKEIGFSERLLRRILYSTVKYLIASLHTDMYTRRTMYMMHTILILLIIGGYILRLAKKNDALYLRSARIILVNNRD